MHAVLQHNIKIGDEIEFIVVVILLLEHHGRIAQQHGVRAGGYALYRISRGRVAVVRISAGEEGEIATG